MAKKAIQGVVVSKASKMSLLQLLNQKVSVHKLLNRVYLNEDRLLDAAIEQPDLIVLAGRFRVQRMHIRVKLQTKLDLAKAQAGLRQRKVRDAGGKKLFTEGEVKERIELDPKVMRIRRKVDRALALEELAKNLMDVFRTRSDSLRIIVQAGKVSLHAKEIEMLKGNERMGKAVKGLRRSWESHMDN